MGGDQAVQPLFSKEGIRPAMMVRAARPAAAVLPSAEDVPQTPAQPAVQIAEGRGMAMFEVFKPASQRAVDVVDDLAQAVPVVTVGLGSDGRFEFRQALPPREASMLHEVIA